MKNFNLFNRVNPDGLPTVNRQSRLTSVQGQYSVWATKFLTTLLLILTLGVGQMWADSGAIYNCYFTYNDGSNHSHNQDDSGMSNKDLGTLSSDLKIKAIYLKVWDDWDDSNNNGNHKWEDGQFCYTKDNFTTTSYCKPSSWTYGSRSKNSDNKYRNYELQKSSTDYTIASLTEASGSYTLKYYWQVWHNTTNSYLNNGGGNYQFTYKIRPPEVDGGDFTIVPANYISGTGADSDHPMLIANGQTSTTFTVTASKEHADANSKLWVSFDNGSNWSQGANATATTVTSSSMTVDGTVRSFTVKVKFKHNSESLESATVLSKTIYYKEQPAGITVNAGSNGTVSVDNSSWSDSEVIEGISLDTWYNIYAKGNTHYDFGSWSKGTNSSNITLEGSTASTRIKIASGAVSSVTANFVEHPYTITINNGTAASTTAGVSTLVGQATVSVPFGKRFKDWTKPASNFTLVEGTSTTSSTIKFNATADGTVTANFNQNYAFIEGRFHVTNLERTGSWTNTKDDGDCWSTSSTNIRFEYDETNHYFYRHTYATPKELTTQIASNTPYFHIRTSTSDNSLSGGSSYYPASNTPLATADEEKSVGTTGSNNFYFNNSSDQSGYVVLYFNGTKVWYSLEQRLKYNGNGSTSGSVASTYHARSTNATAAANGFSKTGHDFTGWKTEPSSGTFYAVGATVPISSSDVTLYAQWTPKSYDITYNPASPTNFAYTVQPSTGTYNTTVSITVTPNQNYKITGVTANKTGAAGTSVSVSHTAATNVYTFTQPAYGVTFNVTAASYDLTASISSKSYENRTFNLSKSSTYNPEGTLNTNWFVYYTCTAKPDGATCTIDQSTGVATVDKDGDYTFTAQYRTASGGAGTLLAESSGVMGTMRTIPDRSGLTISHAKYSNTYMSGDGASETPYFVYLSRATDYGKLSVSATLPAALLSGESLYYSLDGTEKETVTVDGTAASVTMDLPNKAAGDKRSTVIRFYSKLDGQVAPSAKMASVTVYYTVSANPVVTISATCDDSPIVGDIPQNATIVVSASATNIPGEPTFVFKKGDGDYSSTTSYTIAAAGTTTMYAKTTYLGDDWTNSMNITTYATNSVTYVLSKTDLYGDDASTSTSRLFKSGGEEHTAPTLDGYTFTGWTCTTSYVQVSDDSGNTWKSSSSNATVYVRATAAGGTLTATYTVKNRIYFDDTNTGWGSVTVYLFSDNVWHSDMGVQPKENRIEYSTMTRIGESKVYYHEYDCSSSDIKYVAFSKANQNNYNFLYATRGAYRADWDDCTPVYVSNGVQNDSKNSTNYFSSGYWRRYMPQTAPFSLHLVSPDDVDEGKFEIEHEGVDEENFVKEVALNGNSVYEFNLPSSCGGTYGNTGSMTKDSHTNWTFTKGTGNCHITTTATGIYKFYLSTADGKVKLTVEYPLSQGDYQVYYSDNTGSNNNYSNYIRKNTSGSTKQDKVSFFVKKNASPQIQIKRCTEFSGSTPIWENVGSAKTLTVGRDSVYNYIFEQNGTGTTIDTVGHEYYSGNYYIRTDGAAGGWMNYLSNPDNKMKHTDKASALAAGYNYYYMRYIGDASGNSTANVKFCIATDYNDCVSQEHGNDPAGGSFPGEQYLTGKGANVRFTYHPGTNVTTRTCIGGSAHDPNYLVISGTNLQKSDGSAWATSAMTDLNDWIYTFELKAADEATIQIQSHYNNNYVTVYPSKKVLDVGDSEYYPLRIVYNYKTNEVVAAYVPTTTVSSELTIDVDIMFIRQAKDNKSDEDAPTTTLTLSGSGKITGDPKTLYGAIKFEKDFVRAEGSYAGLASHRPQRSTYWISLPFDVQIKDIFGLGDYTETWILQRYRGDLRASKGWFLETSSFWEYIFDTDYVLEAGQGYVLSIDCEAIQWPNNQTEQYLYFPSKDKISDISSVLPSASMDVPEYTCSITTPADRTIKDSHWNVIGIPGFADAWGKATETVSAVGGDFHYFYEWDASSNTLSSESTKKYNFKFMHSYMVQYHGNINWSADEPAPVPARRAANARPEEMEFRLELMQGEQEADHTFITLMDKEQITTGFDMNSDLVKMENANKANIYTIINNDIQAAANCLPMIEQTTVVPVGVKIAANGEYTFAIPDGTNGIGVTLIDNETGVRTPLGLTDYVVTLAAGTYDQRFVLEISPIHQTPTGIESSAISDQPSVRKVLIDNILYIVKDGVVYDARGAKVQ